MNKVIIYGLFDPRTCECFYVGKTINSIKQRLREHIKDKTYNYFKRKVIEDIIKSGLKPIIKELLIIDNYFDDVLGCNIWEYYEMYFIKYIRDELKEPLTNIDDGGYEVRKFGNTKIVKQYDLKGNYIQTFNSINAAAKHIIKDDLNRLVSVTSLIGNAANIKNKQLTAYNFQWCIDGNESYILLDVNEFKKNNKPKEYKHSNTFNQNKIELEAINIKEKELKETIKQEKKLKRIEIKNSPEAIEERKSYCRNNIKKWKQTEEGKQKRKEQRERYKLTEGYKEKIREQKKRYLEKKKNNII